MIHDALELLTAHLKDVEAIPFTDPGKVVTFAGGDAKIQAKEIKECIRIVERVRDGRK